MNKIIVILFQLLFINVFVWGDTLTNGILSDDYTCLYNLLDKFNLLSSIAKDPNNLSNLYFCNDAEVDTSIFTCRVAPDNSLYTLKIVISDMVSTQIVYDDLGCFTSMYSLDLQGFKFSIDSFGEETLLPSPVSKSLYLSNCAFPNGKISSGSIPVGTEIMFITLGNLVNSNMKTINLSTFKNVNYTLSFQFNEDDVTGSIEAPFFNNDLQEKGSTINIKSLIIDTYYIPSMAGITVSSRFDLYLKNPSVSTISFSNFTTYTNIFGLYIINKYPIKLPSELYSSNIIKQLIIGGKLIKPINYIDFSNSGLEYFDGGSSGIDFNINGIMPIINLPSTLTHFLISNNSITTFPISLFSNSHLTDIIFGNNQLVTGQLPDLSNLNLFSLILGGNSFTSTIPESYCSIPNLMLNNNQLTGKLPLCISCYLNFNPDLIERFENNSLLDTSYYCPIGSIRPNLKYDIGANKLEVTGVNLGFTDPSTSPGLEFTMVKASYKFEALLGNVIIPKVLTLSFASENFVFDTIATSPLIKAIFRGNGLEFTFSGESLGYEPTNFNVKIGGFNCPISYVSYYYVKCIMNQNDMNSIGNTNQQVKTIISTIQYNFNKQITIDSTVDNQSTPVVECLNDCSTGGGYCNTLSGTCIYTCPNDCTSLSNGVCNTLNGICKCSSTFQGLDCSLPYKSCPRDCVFKGSCNNQTGECSCISDYTGSDCTIPSQYISSISSTTTSGGLVSIIGWFGSIHTDLSIKIGSLDCVFHFYNESFINCTISSGSGTQSVTVYQNGITWIGKDIFHYTELTYSCPNDCSLHGVCNTAVGQCKCYSGWVGFDCNSIKSTPSTSTTTTTSSTTTSTTPEPTSTPSPIIIPPTQIKVDPVEGSAIINNQQTSYEILITSLVEINVNGEQVKSHKLQKQWNVMTVNDSNIYKFNQTLNETECIISYSIEELKESRDYEFAGLQLSLEKDSIKISVSILNYQYLNSLNTLQLQIQSLIGIIESSDNGGECNDENTKIDSNQFDKNKLLNYITISKNQKTLYGRFINRVISDSHSTFITTSIIQNDDPSIITIGLNLPHFKTSCEIDPDFSVLVSQNYKTCVNGELVDESGRASWVLPVAIVVPCVTVAALLIIGAIIYRKNRTNILLVKHSFNLKNLSRKNKDELYMPNNNK